MARAAMEEEFFDAKDAPELEDQLPTTYGFDWRCDQASHHACPGPPGGGSFSFCPRLTRVALGAFVGPPA